MRNRLVRSKLATIRQNTRSAGENLRPMPPHDSPKSGPAARLLSGRRPAFSETIRPHPTAETRQKARRAHRQWSGETRTKPHANDSKTIEDEIAKTRTRHSLPPTRRRMAADRPGRSVCISYRIICVRPLRRTGMLASAQQETKDEPVRIKPNRGASLRSAFRSFSDGCRQTRRVSCTSSPPC